MAELTVQQALQKAVAAQKKGKLQDAERLYRATLQSAPSHPDANHNLGVLAVSVNQTDAAIPLFKTALEANPKIEQFWLSYIDALVRNQHFDEAREVVKLAYKQGIDEEKLKTLESQLNPTRDDANSGSPNQHQLDSLLRCFQEKRYGDAEKLALKMTHDFPMHKFAWKILGAVLGATGRGSEAIGASQKVIALSPEDAAAHNNLGVSLKELGILDEAKASFSQAISLKPDFAEAYYNLGNTLAELGRLDEAEASYNQATLLKPNYAPAFWNLHGIQRTIAGAEDWIDKCLMANTRHLKALFTKAALSYYRGDSKRFDDLKQSEFRQHPFTRSMSWFFNLPNLPELYFSKWYFFDAIVKKSMTSRPFYEFGVWRATSFKYLIEFYRKGYGFDTFTGLPEDWLGKDGNVAQKAGTYTSNGNVPEIEGGEFIVGKFEDTLPVFFSESRPTASLINFDADLYSSTICALNFSRPVIDKHTILIFDEFIVNESWEQDEFKALEEFCLINQFSYEVIAVSFFSKQVAIRLIGI